MNLESIISGALASVMPSLYRDGKIRTVSRTDSPNGDVSESWTESTVKIQRDVCTEAMIRSAGYTERNAALIILAYGAVPTTDDEAIDADGGGWRLLSVARSADTSHWVCHATPL